MIARDAVRPARLLPFALAFGLAIPLAGLSDRIAPSPGFTSIEVGNDFVALIGLVWSCAQAWRVRSVPRLRAAWLAAASGAFLITAEDHLEAILAAAGPGWIETSASAAMWIAAACLMFVCARRYAMRRFVQPVMLAALGAEAVALALALVVTGAHLHGATVKIQEASELLTTLLFVSGLVLAEAAPMKSYRFRPNEIGERARRLFYDFGLETRRRYPTPYRLLALPVFSQLLTLAIIAWFAPKAARAAEAAGGKTVWGQLRDMLRLGLVHGVDAKSYYVHDLYLPSPTAEKETMTRVETKNGLNKALQDLRAGVPGPRDMNDKLEFWRACEAHGVASAPIYACVEDGVLIWQGDREKLDRDLFVKERKGRGGRFTLNFRRVAPFLYLDDEGATLDLDALIERLQALAMSRRLMIQPKLANHPAIASLADKALVVFRVMTCLDQRDEPRVTHGVLRLLRRFEPDWPKTADADWGCAIDIETGAFGLMTGDAPETATVWFADHPVTGERVTGRRLAGWRDIADLALAAHRTFSARTLVGWDIAWTPDGPTILEGNSNPDFSYFQRVSRTPVGRSPLGPLLNWRLDALTAALVAQSATTRVER